MNDAKPILVCRELHKSFHDGTRKINILNGVDLAINQGECVAILGASGTGKSTLLHLLGGLDHPSTGDIFLAGKDLATLTEKQRCRLRNEHLGFVYQFHHLLPEFSALENVAMPLLIRGEKPVDAQARAKDMLTAVGLGERLQHTLGQLSGGERQRTAIARALVTQPLCVMADEPTGNLDKRTAEQVAQVMLTLNKQRQTSLLIVTHDTNLAEKMDRILRLEDGLLHSSL